MNLEKTKNEQAIKQLLIIGAVVFYVISGGLQQALVYESWKLLIVKIITAIGFPVLLLTIGSLIGSKAIVPKRWRRGCIVVFFMVSIASGGMIFWQYRAGEVSISSVTEFIHVFLNGNPASSYTGIYVLTAATVIVPIMHTIVPYITKKQVEPYLYLCVAVTIGCFFLNLLEISVNDMWGMIFGSITCLIFGWYIEQDEISKKQIYWSIGVGIASFLFLFVGTFALNQNIAAGYNGMLFSVSSVGSVGLGIAVYILATVKIKQCQFQKLPNRFRMLIDLLSKPNVCLFLMTIAVPIRKLVMDSPKFRGDQSISILISSLIIYVISAALALGIAVLYPLIADSAWMKKRPIWIHAKWRFVPGLSIKEAILPLVFLTAAWVLYLCHWQLFEVMYWNKAFDWTWLALAGITVFALIKIEVSPALQTMIKAVIVVAVPFWIMCVTELVNENTALLMGKNQIWLNYSCYLLLFFIFYAITNQIRIAVILEAVTMTIFGIANMYVLRFRGSPILPWDLYSIKTAASVAGTYNYDFTAQMLSGIMYAMWIWLIVYPLKRESWRWYCHLASIVAVVAVVCVCWSNVVMQGKLKDMGIERNIWKQEDGYHTNGMLLSFVENAKDFKLREPDGYNKEEQKALLAETTKEQKKNKNKKYPNVIVVMNESFADISGMADDGILNINKEVTPFVDKWKDNVIKGHFLSSVLGGGTAKSEFEFLTGNSGAFYPSGSMPYQQFIHQEMESMASILGDLGYTSIAFHPYLGTGWDRNRVYPLMGFEDFITLDDMPEDMDKVRVYCSDKGDYDKVLQILDEHDKQESPLFLFNITMQNHGSYVGTYDNFSVDIQESNMNYEELNQYLSLIHLSDQALEELVKQLTAREEDVIVCFFGDHLPGLDWSFYQKITPNDSEFDRTVKAYTVPFYIWANYDLNIDKKKMELTSANYLGMHLLEMIGAPLTPWYQYLHQLEKELPVVSAIAYADKDGKLHPLDDAAMEVPAMKKYQNMQYYYFYDRE